MRISSLWPVPRASSQLLIVEADGVDHQRVTFPSADRISLPRRRHVRGVLAPVHEDLTKGRLDFIQNHDDAVRMNDLERLRQQVALGRLSGRQFSVGLNAPGCVCCRSRSTPYGVSGRSSGLKSARTSRKYLEFSDSPIPKSPPGGTWVALHLPDAREIGLAVQARHRPGHVDLAVARARCSCHWMVHPLRAGRHTGHDARDRNPQDGAKSTSHGCHLTTASGVGHTVCPSRVVHSVTGRPAAMFVVVTLHAGCPGAGWNRSNPGCCARLNNGRGGRATILQTASVYRAGCFEGGCLVSCVIGLSRSGPLSAWSSFSSGRITGLRNGLVWSFGGTC